MSSELQHKLQNFEAEPPASAWEGIVSALDKDNATYANRLFNLSVTPPATAWAKLEQQLETTSTEHTTPVVPISKNKLFKYAMAAAVLIAVAIGITYNTDNQISNTVAQSSSPAGQVLQTIKKAVTPSPEPSVTASAPVTTPAVHTLAASAYRATYPAKKAMVREKHTAQPLDKDMANAHSAEPLYNVVPADHVGINTNANDRYMVATNATGDAVRLPKKVYSNFSCIGDAAAINETNCKEIISSLQSKMASSMATDFAGFLDLLKNLQENTK